MKKVFLTLAVVAFTATSFASTGEVKQNDLISEDVSECCTSGRSDEDGDFVTVRACRTTRAEACKAAQDKIDTLVPM